MTLNAKAGHGDLNEVDAAELCSLLQDFWAKTVAKEFTKTFCADPACAETLSRVLTENWHRRTENVETFTGYSITMETHGGYCDKFTFARFFQALFFQAMLNHLLQYRGVYAFDELNRIVPPGGLVAFFTGRDRLMLIFSYMQRMQNLKKRGSEWTDKMEELMMEMATLDSLTQ